jgi:hypothetical protein
MQKWQGAEGVARRLRRWRREIQGLARRGAGGAEKYNFGFGGMPADLPVGRQLSEMAQRNTGMARRGAGDAEAQGGQRNTVLVLWRWQGLFLGTEEPG